MIEVIAVPAGLYFSYRVFVVLVSAWVARPRSRLDLERFERAMAIQHRAPRALPGTPIPQQPTE